ncbi:MAG TPA: carboxypeptidase-like regulatory domain-containing protein, partial [Polyangia bacterium]|nr:carboxypeptidase-like regulatory domain-containing protein [Polyangia bacterium]
LVELLCNIHASMRGFLYVVDSAYYAQPRPSGAFTIRGVPPGRYELKVWHEASAEVLSQPLSVGAGGSRGVTVNIPSDHPASAVVPDKYGKPRQPQLGY